MKPKTWNSATLLLVVLLAGASANIDKELEKLLNVMPTFRTALQANINASDIVEYLSTQRFRKILPSLSSSDLHLTTQILEKAARAENLQNEVQSFQRKNTDYYSNF